MRQKKGRISHLFVDVEVLSDAEPAHPPTVGAVVGKLALVRVGLSHQRQLGVPHLAGGSIKSGSSGEALI